MIDDVINSIPNRQLLRVGEVATLLQVTKITIYNWYENEKIHGTKVNGVIRIYRQSVVDLITSGNGKKADEKPKQETAKKNPQINRLGRGGWVKGWRH